MDKTYCTKAEALKAIDGMDDKKLNEFIEKCPPRVQILVRGHMVDYREVLADWYMRIPF
jgi:hypothetical protein